MNYYEKYIKFSLLFIKFKNNTTYIEKLNYLPEAHTDFILAVIGEELGFVGVMVIIFLFYCRCDTYSLILQDVHTANSLEVPLVLLS